MIRIGNISRKFPNLINLSVISIFISDSNHLIGIQLTFQGDIAQLGIQRIFRRSKFPGTLYFHIILPPLDTINRKRLQSLCHQIDITSIGITVFNLGIQRVGVIHRILLRGSRYPMVVTDMNIFGQIHKTDNIPRLFIITLFIRNPNFYSIDTHAR